MASDTEEKDIENTVGQVSAGATVGKAALEDAAGVTDIIDIGDVAGLGG